MGKLFQIHDKDAAKRFEELELFLGTKAIEQRLSRILIELNHEKGIYRDYWVLPNRAWWLAFASARKQIAASGNLAGELTPEMFLPLFTAVDVSLLLNSMPDAKKKEFASRIISADNLTPVLSELSIAAQFVLEGFTLTWSEADKPNSPTAPEFSARKDGVEIEIECKSKGSDAGRRVLRRNFYRLSDEIEAKFEELQLSGRIEISISDKLPAKAEWRKELINSIPNNPVEQDIFLSDGTHLNIKTTSLSGRLVKADELIAEANQQTNPFAHFAFTGGRSGEFVIDPLIFKVQSKSQDQFLKATISDLAKANSQFSGTRPSIIFCYLPDVATFEGVGPNSGLVQQTNQFFDQKAKDCLHTIVYFSDHGFRSKNHKYEGDAPAIYFFNQKYNQLLGDCTPIIRSILQRQISQ